MTIHQSDYAKGSKTAPNPHFSGVAVTHRFSMLVGATVALDDILEIAVIPPGCRVTDIVLDVDQLDTDVAATLALDVGIMSGVFGDKDDSRTCGDEFFDGDDTAGTGGVARPSQVGAYRVPVANTHRAIGVKIAAAATAAAAGEIGLTVTYAAE